MRNLVRSTMILHNMSIGMNDYWEVEDDGSDEDDEAAPARRDDDDAPVQLDGTDAREAIADYLDTYYEMDLLGNVTRRAGTTRPASLLSSYQRFIHGQP